MPDSVYTLYRKTPPVLKAKKKALMPPPLLRIRAK